MLGWLLLRLGSVMNSVFLVGDDLGYLNAYVNSLALLFNQPDLLTQTIYSTRAYIDDTHGVIERIVERLKGKRLHSFNMEKFLTLGSNYNKEDWDQVFAQLIQETQENGYFLVIDSIHTLFAETNRERFQYPLMWLYFATRGVVKLTFIAPITWPDYVHHIEHPAMTRHRQPFFFTPRPPDLSFTPVTPHDSAPDSGFSFVTAE